MGVGIAAGDSSVCDSSTTMLGIDGNDVAVGTNVACGLAVTVAATLAAAGNCTSARSPRQSFHDTITSGARSGFDLNA